MGVLDALVPVVKNIVDIFGVSVTFEVETGQSYDQSLGEYAGGSSTSVSVTVTPPGPVTRQFAGSVETDQAADLTIGLPGQGLTFTPKIGQKVTFGGSTYRIVKVSPVYTGALVGLYILDLNGSE